MIEEKNEKNTTNTKLIRVYPKAFAVDDKLKQSLAIFEDAKSKVTFSVTLGAPEEISGLLKDSTHTSQNPYRFASKVLETFEAKPKKAIIKSENDIDLCLKQEDVRGFKKINIGINEMLGLWNLHDFPIYSKPDFIDSIRHVDLQSDKESGSAKSDMYKAYGQKYLM